MFKSINRSTQLIIQLEVRSSSLLLGVDIHRSQHVFVNCETCCNNWAFCCSVSINCWMFESPVIAGLKSSLQNYYKILISIIIFQHTQMSFWKLKINYLMKQNIYLYQNEIHFTNIVFINYFPIKMNKMRPEFKLWGYYLKLVNAVCSKLF